MNMRPLRAILLLAVPFLFGCTQAELKEPQKDKAEVLSLLDQHAAQLHSLSAKVNMQVKLTGMSGAVSLSANFAAQAPSSLRLRGEHPLSDVVPLDIGSDAATWWVLVHYQDTFRVDYGPVAEIDRLNPDIPLIPDQVVAALGMTPIRDNPPVSHWTFTVHPGHYLFQEILGSDDSRVVATRITVDGDSNLITRYETLFPSGRTNMLATVEGYRKISGIDVPRSIKIRLLGRKQENRIDFDFSEVKVAPVLPPNVFRPPDFNAVPQRFRHPAPKQAFLSVQPPVRSEVSE